ncbi:MAG: hypothetical protein IIW43_02910 [Selenomonadales bacterium]|nr:hypothetical protein [Selenomonadales bacterium]
MAVVTVIESRSRGSAAIVAVAGGRYAVSTLNGKMADGLSACGHTKRTDRISSARWEAGIQKGQTVRPVPCMRDII